MSEVVETLGAGLELARELPWRVAVAGPSKQRATIASKERPVTTNG